jgi:hypothetical protein
LARPTSNIHPDNFIFSRLFQLSSRGFWRHVYNKFIVKMKMVESVCKQVLEIFRRMRNHFCYPTVQSPTKSDAPPKFFFCNVCFYKLLLTNSLINMDSNFIFII